MVTPPIRTAQGWTKEVSPTLGRFPSNSYMGILVPLFGKFEASPNDFCRMQRSEGERRKKKRIKGFPPFSPFRLFAFSPFFFKSGSGVCKPSSVSPGGPGARIIPLARALLPGSATYPGASSGPLSNAPLFGLAPGGVLPCQPCHQGCGELLPRLFTLTLWNNDTPRFL